MTDSSSSLLLLISLLLLMPQLPLYLRTTTRMSVRERAWTAATYRHSCIEHVGSGDLVGMPQIDAARVR